MEEGDELRTLLATTDLAVAITGRRASGGTTIGYTVTVTNLGPNPASSTRVSLTLRGAATWLDSLDTRCRRDGSDRLACELGELVAEDSRAFRVVASARRSRVVRTTAVVSNRFGPDLNPSDNLASIETHLP